MSNLIRIVLIGLFILSAGNTFAGSKYVIDQDGVDNIYITHSNGASLGRLFAQSFVPTTFSITAIQGFIDYGGGDIVAEIRTDDGGYPSDTALGSSSTETGNPPINLGVSFDPPILLTPGKKYYIVMYVTSSSRNYVANTGYYSNGDAYYKEPGGKWKRGIPYTGYENGDFQFRTYSFGTKTWLLNTQSKIKNPENKLTRDKSKQKTLLDNNNRNKSKDAEKKLKKEVEVAKKKLKKYNKANKNKNKALEELKKKYEIDIKTLAKEIENLKAVNAALLLNEAEFRELRKQGQASKSEIREFAKFVAGLKRQLIEGCESVYKLGGDANQHGVDCLKFEDELELKKGGVSSNFTRKLTREEKAALLTRQLKKLENEFDGMILKQEAKIRKTREANQPSGNWESGNVYESETSEITGTGILADGTAANSGSKVESVQQEPEPGRDPGAKKQVEMPDFKTENIEDGSDDDIVGRQLREAAEAETDPILKEQLWNEYKKYKNSIR